jgi:hypothetical protein
LRLDLVVQVTVDETVQWLPRENDFRPIAMQASTKSKLKACNELELMRGESFRDTVLVNEAVVAQ